MVPPCPSARAVVPAEPGQGLAWKVRWEPPRCVWEAPVSPSLHKAMQEGVAVGWWGFDTPPLPPALFGAGRCDMWLFLCPSDLP